MTLIQVKELFGYWQKYPPLFIMVKSFMGIKTEKEKIDTPDEAQLKHLVQSFKGQ